MYLYDTCIIVIYGTVARNCEFFIEKCIRGGDDGDDDDDDADDQDNASILL